MAAGVHGLNGAHVQKFVEEEWRQGIASVTVQPQHMEEETVVEKGQKNLSVTPTIVQVVYHETRLILLITHNLSPPPGLERQTKTPRNFAPYLHHSVTWGGRGQSRFTCSLAYFNSHNQQCPAKSSFDNNLVKCRYLLTEQLIRTSYMESFLNIWAFVEGYQNGDWREII